MPEIQVKASLGGGVEMSEVQNRLEELGIQLSTPPEPAASYVPARQTGNLLYVSGQDCRKDGVLVYEGKVGSDLTVEQGQEAARQAAINCLSVLQAHLGSLDRVEIIEVFGFVNSAPGFVEQPYVINGASDLFERVFGERGRHARVAVAANELPFNTPVEVKMVVEVG